MADLVFLLILVFCTVHGVRRGFYLDVIQNLTILVLFLLAWVLGRALGSSYASMGKLSTLQGQISVGFLVFVFGGFVLGIPAQLLLKKIKGEEGDDSPAAVPDANGGDTQQGPEAQRTAPSAGKKGFVYWSDKILGAGSGFMKGCAISLLLFGVIVCLDHCGATNSFARSIEGSYATMLFEAEVEPYLERSPEYKIARSLDELWNLSQEIETEAEAERLQGHPQLQPLLNHPKLQELMRDPRARLRGKALLENPKVRQLLADDEFRELLGEVDWSEVRADLSRPQPALDDLPEAEDDEAAPR